MRFFSFPSSNNGQRNFLFKEKKTIVFISSYLLRFLFFAAFSSTSFCRISGKWELQNFLQKQKCFRYLFTSTIFFIVLHLGLKEVYSQVCKSLKTHHCPIRPLPETHTSSWNSLHEVLWKLISWFFCVLCNSSQWWKWVATMIKK